MYHDKNLIDAAKEQLFSMGEGQIGYIRPMRSDEMEQIRQDSGMQQAWGVFSATGEVLAICDSPASAWNFFAEQDLAPVSVH